MLTGCGYTVVSSKGSSGGPASGHAGEGRPSGTMTMLLIDNVTAEPLLGEIVSERLKAQLLAAGPWHLVNPNQQPELVLNGRVSKLRSTPVAFDADGKATEYQLELRVNFVLTRASDGSTLWSAIDMVGFSDYYVDKNSVALSRESKERAFQDVGQRLAENVTQQLSLLPPAPAAPPSEKAGTTPGPGGTSP